VSRNGIPAAAIAISQGKVHSLKRRSSPTFITHSDDSKTAKKKNKQSETKEKLDTRTRVVDVFDIQQSKKSKNNKQSDKSKSMCVRAQCNSQNSRSRRKIQRKMGGGICDPEISPSNQPNIT
jgi:hypothetical protein